jgi:hypothetical protein
VPCTSFLDGEQPQGSPGQVTYIVDKGLVTFGKFAGSILAIFLTVGIFLYGLDVKQLRKEIEDTHVGSQKLDLDIKQAKMDLKRETADIKKDIESAEASAKHAKMDLEKETVDNPEKGFASQAIFSPSKPNWCGKKGWPESTSV